ncbi:MAG TPA: EamA family transporter [Candidatus Omnitrophota bacterium]|nr:EamA family transporter [Candidatus Omnitrophota bacterium]
MVNYLILVVSVLLAVIGQLLMKQGMNQFGTFPVTQLLQKLIPMIFNPWVFAGLVSFAFSSVFWLVVLSRLNLSLVYPMVSLAYVVVAFASIVFFKETISITRWLGILVICFGVLLISRS